MKTLRYIFILLFVFICLICNAENTFPTNYRDHNKVNTCKNLLQKYTLDELSMMISTGNFDDIYVGDYIEMEMTSDYGTEKVRWLVAAIDYFKHRTDVDLLDHHIVLVAEGCFNTLHRMNSTNTSAGGFAGSEMFTTTLPKYNTAITNAFGSSHVLSYHQLLTTSVGTSIPSMAGANFTGASNNWNWISTTLCLMSESQLYGTEIGISSFYDIGINNSQFPIFKWLPEKINCGTGINNYGRQAFWLNSVINSVNFSFMDYNGCALRGPGYNYHSNANIGFRPYFLFK